MDVLMAARKAVASDPRNAPFEQWCMSVLDGEHDDHSEVVAALTTTHPQIIAGGD